MTLHTGIKAHQLRSTFDRSKAVLNVDDVDEKSLRVKPGVLRHKTLKKYKTAKKSVSFSNYASVVVRNVPAEEYRARWLQPSEYIEIERRRRGTVHAIIEANGELNRLNEREHCVRGLENQLSPQQCIRRRKTNMRYRQLLMEEQGFQIKCGLNDPEALRRLSEIFSHQSSNQARIRALID